MGMQVINSKAMHDKRGLESVIHTMQAEIDEALQNAKNSEEKSKRAMVDAAKLEMRIRELEMELGSTQSKTGENFKAFQRAERRVKELQFQQEEDRKNQDRMSELANKLQ